MKKILFIFLIVLSGVTTIFSQSNVTLTFSCQTIDSGYLQPYSITIDNLTRNWSETIYYPDTVYTLMVGTNVPDYPTSIGMQTSPNPFDGTTQVRIQSEKTEKVKIRLTDMVGRQCAEFSGLLYEGGNLFSISLTTPQTYVLSVQSSSEIRSLKMENVGRTGANRITYEGLDKGIKPSVLLKSISTHEFELGDAMQYTLYTYLSDTLLAQQTVTQIQNVDDTIIATFPVTQDFLNLSSCPVKSIRTNEIGFGNRVTHIQDFDGNQYPVVQIGEQCWIKENLRATSYADGTPIALSSDPNNEGNTTPNYSFPNNDQSNVSLYGLLYNWAAAMHGTTGSSSVPSGIQGICPSGWHVPSMDECWSFDLPHPQSPSLYSINGVDLADTLGWAYSSVVNTPGNNLNLNNTSGFGIRPAGVITTFPVGFGQRACFWMSDDKNNDEAVYCYLAHNQSSMSNSGFSKAHRLSIRCMRDDSHAKVITDTVIIVSTTSVEVRGIVTSEDDNIVTNRGTYIKPSNPPLLFDEGNGTGVFHSAINGLSIGVPYSARCYASNSSITNWSYGDYIHFAIPHPLETQPCPNASTMTDYDGNVYNTVQIGSQCWMKENLRTKHYSEGTSLTLGETNSTDIAYYYYPNNDSNNVSTYGYLYNWNAVMNGASSSNNNPSGVQGICPIGWHVPSANEWRLLINYVSTQSDYVLGDDHSNIAKALADSIGWDINPSSWNIIGNNLNLNNTTGFGVRPAGSFSSSSGTPYYFHGLSSSGSYWSSSNSSTTKSSYFKIDNTKAYIRDLNQDNRDCGFSVRCVKD